MQLDEFLYCLHFDIDKVRPVDVDVDWDDAPLPYKLYQDLPIVPLPSKGSQSMKWMRSRARSSVDLAEIGDFFWCSYGLTQLCHTRLPFDDGGGQLNVMQMLRRYVPSGGALYPSELYAYLKVDGLVPGIYHYDVAHHRFVLLREGNFDEYLERALGHRCQLADCFGMLFVSTVFWKNFYKYNNFAYRLQGLDAGALIGQLLEVAKQYGYRSFVYFQFLDRAINHLLGLRDKDESVYAAIPLSLTGGMMSEGGISLPTANCADSAVSADALCAELVGLQHKQYVKSQRIADYPMLIKMNESSMLHSTQLFTHLPKSHQNVADGDGLAIAFPKVPPWDCDFAVACRDRYSPGLDFVSGHVDLAEISALLEATTSFTYGNDLDSGHEGFAPRVGVAACVHGVEGLADGAYVYDNRAHALRLLRAGDHRMQLQQGMSMPTVNLFQVPLCLHLIGRRDFYQTTLGYRGHRIQQMETGMFLQRLLLVTSAMGMGGHPLLGYDEGVCDGIYGFGQWGETCLIQVPVGRYRKASRFEGAMRGEI